MTTDAPAGAATGPWLPAAVLCTALATLPFLVVGAVSAAARAVGGRADGAGWPTSFALLPHPAELVSFLAVAAPVWLVGAVAAALVPTLTTRTRLLLAACGPATVAALLVGLTNATGPLAAVDAVVIAAVGVVVVDVLRRTWREGTSTAGA